MHLSRQTHLINWAMEDDILEQVTGIDEAAVAQDRPHNPPWVKLVTIRTVSMAEIRAANKMAVAIARIADAAEPVE